MRIFCQTAIAAALLGCAQIQPNTAANKSSDIRFRPEDLRDLRPPFEQWRMKYDYYGDFYATPAASKKVWDGRWKANTFGSMFQERASGDLYVTSYVDAPLMEHISVDQDSDEWGGCLDVSIVAAIADYPAPTNEAMRWLIVERVVSAEEVPGQQWYRDRCLDW